jgi:hypothetical protein
MKQNRALTIFNVLSYDRETILLGHDLREQLKLEFDQDLALSLFKFFSSYMNQTKCNIIEKDFFVFNLISAANRGKFGMRNFVFG